MKCVDGGLLCSRTWLTKLAGYLADPRYNNVYQVLVGKPWDIKKIGTHPVSNDTEEPSLCTTVTILSTQINLADVASRSEVTMSLVDAESLIRGYDELAPLIAKLRGVVERAQGSY